MTISDLSHLSLAALEQEYQLAKSHFEKTGSYIWMAEVAYQIHLRGEQGL